MVTTEVKDLALETVRAAPIQADTTKRLHRDRADQRALGYIDEIARAVQLGADRHEKPRESS